MGNTTFKRFLCLCGMCTLVLSIKAQSKLDSIQRLDEVVVTAKKYKEVIPAQILKGEELQRLNSFSVADAIRYFSGVQIKDYGGVGGLKTINIRSMGTNHMGVYYNGIQLGNAQNGQVDLGKFSLDNIEEVSLYNGQKSDIFQSAREFGSAGSIYLTTRHPKFNNGETAHMIAKLKAGSYGLVNPAILYEHKINDKVSSSISAEWISSSGKYSFRYRRVTPAGELAYDTTAVRHNSDLDAMRMDIGLYGTFDTGKWSVFAYHYTSERGVPGAIVNNVWKRGERLWDRNSFAQGTYQQDILPKLSTRVNIKYAYDFTRYVNNDILLKLTNNVYKQKEMYLSWANKYSLNPNWDVSLSYDFQWNDLEVFDTAKDVNMEHISNAATRGTHWLSLATAFTLADRLKMQASILGTFVDEKAHQVDKAPNKKKLTPGLFLSYQPFKNTN